MKRHWIEYTPEWRPGPMSYWVHIEADGNEWHPAQVFRPPLPMPIPDKGFPRFYVECDDATFEFASLDELRVCIETLGKKLLPTTIRLAKDRGGTLGPNAHWLSRLPPRAKPWRYREKAVKYLARSLADFERELYGTPKTLLPAASPRPSRRKQSLSRGRGPRPGRR